MKNKYLLLSNRLNQLYQRISRSKLTLKSLCCNHDKRKPTRRDHLSLLSSMEDLANFFN